MDVVSNLCLHEIRRKKKEKKIQASEIFMQWPPGKAAILL